MRLYGTENISVILKELGGRIRDVRIASSVTREELAEKSGVSVRTVARIEGGMSVSFDNLLRVLYAINCSKNVELLVPEQQVLPEDVFSGKKKRVRASKKKTASEWIWGDEE